MNNKPAYLSKEGLEQIRQELEELVNVRRAEVAARIHEAKEHGDISENAEYEDAKNEQAFVEGRIQSLSALIKNAVVIDETHSTTHVQIGSTVTLESQDGKEKFTIVGARRAYVRSRSARESAPSVRGESGVTLGALTPSLPAASSDDARSADTTPLPRTSASSVLPSGERRPK